MVDRNKTMTHDDQLTILNNLLEWSERPDHVNTIDLVELLYNVIPRPQHGTLFALLGYPVISIDGQIEPISHEAKVGHYPPAEELLEMAVIFMLNMSEDAYHASMIPTQVGEVIEWVRDTFIADRELYGLTTQQCDQFAKIAEVWSQDETDPQLAHNCFGRFSALLDSASNSIFIKIVVAEFTRITNMRVNNLNDIAKLFSQPVSGDYEDSLLHKFAIELSSFLRELSFN